jgi:ribokinase
MMIERDSELYVPAIKVSAVDTTGAGDVFNGALAVRLADGDPVERALKYAVVSAGISVTRRGAQDSIPTMEEVDQFIREEMIEL